MRGALSWEGHLSSSQTCIKRSLFGQRKGGLLDKWPLKTGSIHMKFSITGQEKGLTVF